MYSRVVEPLVSSQDQAGQNSVREPVERQNRLDVSEVLQLLEVPLWCTATQIVGGDAEFQSAYGEFPGEHRGSMHTVGQSTCPLVHVLLSVTGELQREIGRQLVDYHHGIDDPLTIHSL